MNFSTKLFALATISLSMASFTASSSAQGNSLMSSGAPSGGSSTAGKPAPVTPASIPPVHPYSTTVRNAVLTVDGMVGKAQMNYDVKQCFMYFTVPGVGTAIVAQTRFMNALPQKGAFHGDVLTINVNGHAVELTNSGPLVGAKVADAWVAIDPLYGANLFPEMGFGNTIQRPYVWPGSKAEKTSANAVVAAPPLPANLRPKPEISSSYTVTVPAVEPANGNSKK
jgi:hypothetical protein